MKRARVWVVEEQQETGAWWPVFTTFCLSRTYARESLERNRATFDELAFRVASYVREEGK